MFAKFARAIQDLWNRPINYGGSNRYGPGRCPCCGSYTDRAAYERDLQARADIIRKRDRLDLMTDAELHEYRKAALKELLKEQGLWPN